MRRDIAVLFSVMALAIAGCGSSAATNGPAGPAGPAATDTGAAAPAASAPAAAATVGALPDPCSLLTADQISGIVGSQVMAGHGTTDHLQCAWDRTDVHAISVTLHLLVLPGTLQCQIGGDTPVDVGIQQAGWHYLANLYTGSVTACPSRLQIQITLVGDLATHTTTEDQLRTDATALMKLVLPKV